MSQCDNRGSECCGSRLTAKTEAKVETLTETNTNCNSNCSKNTCNTETECQSQKTKVVNKRIGRGVVESGLTHECGVFGAIACGEWPTEVIINAIIKMCNNNN